jgi:hypothetical protein
MTRLIVLLACAAALVAGCGDSASRHAAPAGATHRGLPELSDIHQLQAAFDAHPHMPRLLILLSPT